MSEQEIIDKAYYLNAEQLVQASGKTISELLEIFSRHLKRDIGTKALSMSGVSDSVTCDYRKPECTNDGKIIDGVWKCSNHQGTDH